MEKNQKIEEALSVVWEEMERKVSGKNEIRTSISGKLGEDMLDILIEDGLAASEDGTLKLTVSGEAKAKDVIRRQRLAERLLIDVLELGRVEMESSACEFEHILSKEVEESICTLLGHPRECPHGRPIPPGRCCEKAKEILESIVVPLAKLRPGEAGRVVYLLTRSHPQLHRLMSLGLVPGVRILMHQVFPSFIIQIEETQLALERDIAREIYVKKLEK